MALRGRTRHLPELIPHFYLGSLGSAVSAGWLLLNNDSQNQIQGPPLSLTWLVYWLACSAALFMIMLVWDGWMLPRIQRRTWSHTSVPPSVMAILSLLIGCAIPMVGFWA